MLDDFITAHRDAILARAREQAGDRPQASEPPAAIEFGAPLFLTQIVESLRSKTTGPPLDDPTIDATAARHGAELRRAGFSVAQVVHDYNGIGQAITALAAELTASITAREFHTLNRCLDTAIAAAVTEHARITAQSGSADEVERLGSAAHELRDTLNTAILAFHLLRKGTVGIGGGTGAVLGRSLMNLREVVDRTLSEVRLTAGKQRHERLSVGEFIDEIAASGTLHSEYRQINFRVEPVDPGLVVDGDPHLLTSAVMNLLHNGFKSTPVGGLVVLRARAEESRLIVEVEDECGGFPESKGDLFEVFGNRRGADQSGLGLGLSIARKASRAHGGDIHIRNKPGKGCVFVLELPLASDAARAS